MVTRLKSSADLLEPPFHKTVDPQAADFSSLSNACGRTIDNDSKLVSLSGMKSLADQLKPIALFRGLTDDELLLVATCMKSSEISKGRVLFRMGDRSDAAYIVRKGELSAYLQTENQVQEIVKFGPGSVFGELCLVKEGARSLTIRANANTELWRIDRRLFGELRMRKASAAYKLIRNICVTACDRLRTTNQFIEVEVQQGAHFVQWTGAQPSNLMSFKQKIKSFFSKA